MEYQGFAFCNQFDGKRKSGSIAVEFDKLVFTAGDETVLEMPLSRIEVKLSGSGNRILYFTNPQAPGLTFCSSDKQTLKDSFLVANPAFDYILSKVRRKRRRMRMTAVVASVLVIAALLFPFLFADTVIRVAADKVPVEWEQKIGEMLFDSVTANKKFVESEETTAQLAAITEPLVAVVWDNNSEHKFDFYIIEDSTLNAFALPGGKVVIHSGLLLTAESPREAAGVLAHELAHVTCRHHIRGLLKQAGIMAALSFIIGDVSSITDLVASYGGSLALLQNSRAFEVEADLQGWEYLRQANIDARGMVEFFQRLQSENETMETLENELSFLSTHPAVGDRIETLEKKNSELPTDLEYFEFEIDYKKFQTELRKALE